MYDKWDTEKTGDWWAPGYVLKPDTAGGYGQGYAMTFEQGYSAVVAEFFRRLPFAARNDLLRVLTSPSHVRADVIGQFHERGDEGMGEVLAELEADDLLRWQVIDVLRDAAVET